MTHDSFMRAIRAAPDDDGPRLVFADWLEENGEPHRAEFIRVQCARAPLSAGDPRAAVLDERARTLLKNNWDSLVGPLRRLVEAGAGPAGEWWLLGGYHAESWRRFRRGFIEDLGLTAAVLLEHADAIFRTAPLRHLRLWRAGSGVAALARLPQLAGVETLKFADPWHELVRADGMAALAAAPHLGRLTTLDLARNDVADAGTVALAGAPWLAGLRRLNLEENGLSDVGVAALAASPGASGLVRLALGRNGITDAGVRALAASPHLAGLQWLGLHRNLISQEADAILADSPFLNRTKIECGTLRR